MENKKTHSKGNKLVLMILLLLILTASGIVAIILLKDKSASNESEVKTVISNEEAMKLAGSVSDATTLRELLLLDTELKINVTADIEIEKEFVVKGTKTLCGTAKISAKKEPFKELSAFEVAKSASLTIDGLAIDGNGMANGVLVNRGAEFTYLSGEICYTAYGILNKGTATVKNGVIRTAVLAAIYSAGSGTTYVEGGDYLNAGRYFFQIDAKASLDMYEGVQLKECYSSGIYNKGTLVVHGGSITDTVGYGIENRGKLTTKYEGSNKEGYITISNAQEAAVYNCTSENSTIEDVHVVGGRTNSAYISNAGMRELGVITFKNCLFENAGGNSMSVIGRVELYNVTIVNPAQMGIYGRDGADVYVKAVTVTGAKTNAFLITGGTLTGSKVTVKNTGNNAFSLSKSKDRLSTVQLTGIEVTGTKTNNFNITEGVKVTLTDSTLGKSGRTNVNVKANAGKVTLNNVKILGVESDAVGVMSIAKGTTVEAKKVSIEGAANSAVMVYGGTLTGSDLSIKDTKGSAIVATKSEEADAIVDLSNVMITGTKINNLDVREGTTVTLTDATLGKSGRTNVNVKENARKVTLNNVKLLGVESDEIGVVSIAKGASVEAKKVSIEGAANSAVMVYGGTLTGSNLSIEDTKKSAIVATKSGEAEAIVDLSQVMITGTKINNLDVREGATVTLKHSVLDKSVRTNVNAKEGSSITLESVEILGSGDADIAAVSVGTNATVKILGNSMITEGGLRGVNVYGTFIMKGGSIYNHKSDVNGAGVYVYKAGLFKMQGGSIYQNETSKSGGGIYVTGSMDVSGGNIYKNKAVTGGAIYIASGETKISGTTFAENGAKNSAGAIRTEANKDIILTLSNSTFKGNKAGGNGGAVNHNGGKLNLTDCIFKDNSTTGGTGGGALAVNDGSEAMLTWTKTDSKEVGFSGNSAPNGGAVYCNNATVTIDGYCMDGNTAETDGGALYFRETAKVGIQNAKVRNNIAGKKAGAIYTVSPNLKLDTVEFNGNKAGTNGGAIQAESGAVIDITGAVFTANTALSGGAVYLASGKATIKNSNFERNSTTASAGAIRTEANKDIILTLSNNTFKGNQAGTNGGAVNHNGGKLNLTDCIFKDNSTTGGTGGGALAVNDGSEATLTWTKTDSEEIGFSGNSAPNGGAMYCNNATVTIDGYSMDGNTSKTDGGALHLGATAKVGIQNAKMSNNTAGSKGGAISTSSSNLKVTDCVFMSNSSSSHGGAIYMANGTLNLNSTTEAYTDSKFEGNTSGTAKSAKDGKGGAIYVLKGTFYVGYDGDDATTEYGYAFVNNNSNFHGGAISLEASAVVVINKSEFTQNTSGNGKNGGAINSYSHNLTVTNTRFENNSTSTTGGAGGALIANGSKNTSLVDCTFIGNTAWAGNENGGAVKAEGAVMTLSRCTFEANVSKSTKLGGGAIFVKNSTVTVTDSKFAKNIIQDKALGGTAIFIQNSGTSRVYVKGNSVFSDNGKTDIYKAKSQDTLEVDAGISYTKN